MNIDHMIRTGTGRWYDYLGQGVQFGLNMFVSAIGVNGAWNGISNLVGELNYKKMQKLAEKVSWKDIDEGAELDELLGTGRKFSRTSWTEPEFDLQFFAKRSGAKGLIGHDFENYLTNIKGGKGSFSVGGRDFDGGIGNQWWEAKSGNYWNMLEKNPNMLSKFKSDMGDRLRIATENGATYELFSNTPIPDLIK